MILREQRYCGLGKRYGKRSCFRASVGKTGGTALFGVSIDDQIDEANDTQRAELLQSTINLAQGATHQTSISEMQGELQNLMNRIQGFTKILSALFRYSVI